MEQFYCCFLVGDQQSTDSSPGDDDGDDPDDNEGALIMEQFYCPQSFSGGGLYSK